MLVVLSTGALRRNPNARLLLLPVVLVQGLWVADNVITALNQYGVPIEARLIESPFVAAPFTMHPSLLAELLFLLAMLAFLIRRFTIARRREERWEGALEAARQVQNLLLPEAIPQVQGFRIDCVYRPADAVGGDFFQILPCGEGNLLIVVGDVAGKGLPAAMMMVFHDRRRRIRAEAAHTSGSPVNSSPPSTTALQAAVATSAAASPPASALTSRPAGDWCWPTPAICRPTATAWNCPCPAPCLWACSPASTTS